MKKPAAPKAGPTALSGQEISKRLKAELPQWVYADGAIERRYGTGGWKASMLLAGAIGHLAEAAWHHPELTISYPGVKVRLNTHDADGVSERDFALAARIEALVMWRPAQEAGALEGTPQGDERYTYVKYGG